MGKVRGMNRENRERGPAAHHRPTRELFGDRAGLLGERRTGGGSPQPNLRIPLDEGHSFQGKRATCSNR